MNHWATDRIRHLSSKVGSGATPRGGQDSYHDDGVPLIRSLNVHSDGFRRDGLAFLSHEQAAALDNVEVQAGDVLLNITGASIGRVTTAPPDMEGARVNQHVAIIRLVDGLYTPFVAHYLASPLVQQNIHSTGSGVTRPALTKAQILDFELLIPPLPEQHRIVEAIESYFTRLDDAVATLERVQRNLKRYRASVLQAAVEGRLVPTEAELARAERRDYEPASVLLERILTERRRRWEQAGRRGKYQEPAAPDTSSLPELPEGWCWIALEQMASHVVDCLHSTPKYATSGYPAIRTADVVPGLILLDQARRVSEQVFQERIARLEPKDGDIFYTREGERFGIAACVPLGVPMCLSQRMMQVRVVPEVSSRFVMWALNSSLVYGQAARDLGGSTSPHVNMEDIRRFKIPFPPFQEQQRIVAEVERLLSVAVANTSIVEATVSRCSRLRQSILKWAFEGKLADQDPNDEPASVLLERIKAEREAAGSRRASSGRSGVRRAARTGAT